MNNIVLFLTGVAVLALSTAPVNSAPTTNDQIPEKVLSRQLLFDQLFKDSKIYTPTSKSFLSPERGFYRFFNNFESATLDEAKNIRSSGYTLVYGIIRLDNYRTTENLPSDFLNKLQTSFKHARLAGIKVIPRAVYNYPKGDEWKTAEDAQYHITIKHIDQIGKIYQANVDVIYVIQGGFIGLWGEQHGSTNENDQPLQMLLIRAFMDIYFPKSRSIAWR